MNKFMFLLVFVVASAAQADPGRDAAVSVCESIPFASDQTACLQVIRGKQFDPKGVEACKSLPFAADKLSCLRTVADKLFTSEREVNLCKRQPFAAERIHCLKNCDTRPLGGPIGGQIDLPALRRLVIEAQRAVRRRDYYDAMQVLQDLKDEIEFQQGRP